jgi:hypothetical protein
MDFSEKQVRLVARMYEMRDTARTVLGDHYAAKIAEWVDVLVELAAKLEVSPIEAVPMICKANKVSEYDILFLTAAAVEFTEGGDQAPKATKTCHHDCAARVRKPGRAERRRS